MVIIDEKNRIVYENPYVGMLKTCCFRVCSVQYQVELFGTIEKRLVLPDFAFPGEEKALLQLDLPSGTVLSLPSGGVLLILPCPW